MEKNKSIEKKRLMENKMKTKIKVFLTNPRICQVNILRMFMYVIVVFILASSLFSFVLGAPAGPSLTYVLNSTAATVTANRSIDAKGTITVLNMTLTQQDYKWKAYVGNVTGSLALDDANAKSIYDWSLAAVTGEVYVTRASSVSWSQISCVNQSVINAEDAALGISSASIDSINSTFNYTAHKSFLVGTLNITNSSCRSTATYINDARQTVDESAFFQEVLLKDNASSSLIYTTLIDNDHAAYDGSSVYDFQLIVAENESSSVPKNYYFYVELG